MYKVNTSVRVPKFIVFDDYDEHLEYANSGDSSDKSQFAKPEQKPSQYNINQSSGWIKPKSAFQPYYSEKRSSADLQCSLDRIHDINTATTSIDHWNSRLDEFRDNAHHSATSQSASFAYTNPQDFVDPLNQAPKYVSVQVHDINNNLLMCSSLQLSQGEKTTLKVKVEDNEVGEFRKTKNA